MPCQAILIAAVLGFGCGGACSAPTVTTAPTATTDPTRTGAPITEAQARDIAVKTGATAGYSAEDYDVVSAKLQDDGNWWVHVEHIPPTPPGGHYAVEVNTSTGEARLVHGE